MSNYGMKVSLPGKSITSTDARDYLLWSKYKPLKTYITGTVNYTMPSEAKSQTCFTIATVTHNLGYLPLVVLFWQTGSLSSGAYWEAYNGLSESAYSTILPAAGVNDFKIQYFYDILVSGSGNTGLAGTQWTFTYYIFIETGELS